jgi:hypothetical protein
MPVLFADGQHNRPEQMQGSVSYRGSARGSQELALDTEGDVDPGRPCGRPDGYAPFLMTGEMHQMGLLAEDPSQIANRGADGCGDWADGPGK